MTQLHTSGRLLPLLLTSLLAPVAMAQAPFTIGDILVVRIGDGVTPLGTASAATFLDEYTPAGAFVQTIALPTAAAGSNLPFTSSGSVTSAGHLSVSANGIAFTVGGFGEVPGVSSIAQTDATLVPRVIAVADIAGNVDTSTALVDAYSATTSNSQIRSVTSNDGTQFWTSGTAFPVVTAGVRYVANLGATTSTQLNGSSTNNRNVSVFLGQLYVTTMSGSNIGLNAIGDGLPTTSGQAVVQLAGFPGSGSPDSPYDTFWADPDTVYIADDRSQGSPGGLGGIQKWTQSAGVWSLAYTINHTTAMGTAGMRGLTGRVQNGVTTLWATANYPFPNNTTEIVTCVDTGPASVVTTLVTSAADTVFRGIRFIDQPSSLQKFPMTCGTSNLVCQGSGLLGSSLFSKMTNPQGLVPLIALDVTSAFLPLNLVFANCNCTLGTGPNPVLLVSGTSFTLNIQPSWATLGLPVFIQGFDLLTPPGGPCPDLLDLTTTDTYSFSVQ